jgi:hypothetical protein
MMRLILALTITLSLTASTRASLAPPRELRFGHRYASLQLSQPLPPGPHQPAADQEGSPEFLITARTEVLLDGKACRYELIPGHARIVRLELAADNKTVVKIHFRTRK